MSNNNKDFLISKKQGNVGEKIFFDLIEKNKKYCNIHWRYVDVNNNLFFQLKDVDAILVDNDFYEDKSDIQIINEIINTIIYFNDTIKLKDNIISNINDYTISNKDKNSFNEIKKLYNINHDIYDMLNYQLPLNNTRQWRLFEIKTDYKCYNSGNLTYEIFSSQYSKTLGCNRKSFADYIMYFIMTENKICKYYLFNNIFFKNYMENIITKYSVNTIINNIINMQYNNPNVLNKKHYINNQFRVVVNGKDNIIEKDKYGNNILDENKQIKYIIKDGSVLLLFNIEKLLNDDINFSNKINVKLKYN